VSRRSGLIDYRQSAPCFSPSINEVLKKIDTVERDMETLHTQIESQKRVHKKVSASETPTCRNMSEWSVFFFLSQHLHNLFDMT